MAQKRMVSKKITTTDIFLDMPLSTQALYFHFVTEADDEGFIGNPKRITRSIGANEKDLSILISKRFLLTFESMIIVIKHWHIHNNIRMDRYNPTTYKKEKELLTLNEFKAYTEVDKQSGNQTHTTVLHKLSKVKLSKVNINISFISFWNLYNKKIDKDKCEKKWNNLSDNERTQIMNHIPKYKSTIKEKVYQKNPSTYLNNNSWENEIIIPATENNITVCKDGTKAIKHNGKWVDSSNKFVKLDLSYYPELRGL